MAGKLNKGIEFLFKKNKITHFVGSGKIVSGRKGSAACKVDVQECEVKEELTSAPAKPGKTIDSLTADYVLAATGSIKPHTKFTARVYVLTKDEGGRHTPFYNGYRPQFYLRTTDVTGAISLQDGAEMIMPGDNVDMDVELITPIALEPGMRFAIREGGRTVGAGAITAVED